MEINAITKEIGLEIVSPISPEAISAVEISKLTLKPNDVLVIRFPKEMGGRQADCMAAHIRKSAPPDIYILFLLGDIELTVLRKDDTDSPREEKICIQ